MWALPTPGLWNKTGLFWQYSQCRWNKAGAAAFSLGAALAFSFYKYCVSLSPYRTISWFSTWSHPRYLWVHFFVMFSLARYSIFSRDWSLGNTPFVFVTFRYWRFRPSMMFVVLSRNRYSTTYADKKTIPTFPRIAVTTMPF